MFMFKKNESKKAYNSVPERGNYKKEGVTKCG